MRATGPAAHRLPAAAGGAFYGSGGADEVPGAGEAGAGYANEALTARRIRRAKANAKGAFRPD